MALPATRLIFHLVLALTTLIGSASIVGAQTTTLDEGTFRITVAGRDVGSETFSISQSGSENNASYNARGQAAVDTAGVSEEFSSVLQLKGATLRPTAYNLRVRQGDREGQIAGRITAGRFVAKILSPTGEELREYLASDRAVLIDQGVIHHYYFLARRVTGDALQIPVIIPRQGKQIVVQVEPRGEESIAVGSQRVTARHLTISPEGGDEVHLWIDDRARILQYRVPAHSLTARRTTLPR